MSPAQQSANRPFAPARLPFFYGWVILAVATVGVVASIPGQTMGVSVFTDPLVRATGLSRLELSNAYLVGTITSGLCLPYGGRLLDRLGARIVGVGACLGLGLTLVLLSSIDLLANPLEPSLGPWAALVLLALGFTALRFTGQGMLTMVSRNLIGKWFEKRRGLASSLSGVFVAFGFASAPLFFSFWISASGWRGAWRGLAALVILGMGTLIVLLFRDSPEACGLMPDGRRTAADAKRAEAQTGDTFHYDRAGALRTGAFWAVTLSLALHGMVVTGFSFHIVDVGRLAGLGREEVVSLFLPMAIVSTATGFLMGVLSDRVQLKWLILFMLVAEIVSYSSLRALHVESFKWLGIAASGVVGGCFSTMSTVALPRFFGSRQLGAISGMMMMCMVIASALGPPLFALSESLTGSYGAALLVGAACTLPLFCATLLARDPQTARGAR